MSRAIEEVLQHLGGLAPDLAGGNAGRVTLKIDRIVLGDQVLKPPAAGIMVVVGGNNVGKSTLLRELYARSGQQAGQSQPARLLSGVNFEVCGTSADFLSWILCAEGVHVTSAGSVMVSALAGVAPKQELDANSLIYHVRNTWPSQAALGNLSVFRSLFINYADTQARLGLAASAPVRENANDAPTHPVHILAGDPDRLRLLNGVSQRIFGEHVVLDDQSASNRLRISPSELPMTLQDGRPSQQSRQTLLALPELDEQGDGMRSLIGLLLPVLAGDPGLTALRT